MEKCWEVSWEVSKKLSIRDFTIFEIFPSKSITNASKMIFVKEFLNLNEKGKSYGRIKKKILSKLTFSNNSITFYPFIQIKKFKEENASHMFVGTVLYLFFLLDIEIQFYGPQKSVSPKIISKKKFWDLENFLKFYNKF